MKDFLALDLDGTLLDSRSRHRVVLDFCLKKRNLKIPTNNLLKFKSEKHNNKDFLRQYLKDENLINEIQADWIENIEKEEFLEKDFLYEDSRDFLNFAKEKYNLVLITARNNKTGVDKFLKRLGIEKYFEEIFIVGVGRNSAEEKANKLVDIKPSAMIGDTEVDYDAAKNLNIKFFAINRGFRSEEFWNDYGLKSYNNLKELEEYI